MCVHENVTGEEKEPEAFHKNKCWLDSYIWLDRYVTNIVHPINANISYEIASADISVDRTNPYLSPPLLLSNREYIRYGSFLKTNNSTINQDMKKTFYFLHSSRNDEMDIKRFDHLIHQ